MEYRVVITSDAEADLDGFLRYLLFAKKHSFIDRDIGRGKSSASP